MDDKIREQLREIEEYLEACETIHEIETQLIEEKKTREEYAKKKFLKKHDYDKETGTVDVGDGRRSKIRLNAKYTSHSAILDGTRDGDNGVINLNNKFFKLKNAKRREGIFQHEVGHGTLHTTGNNIGNRASVTPSVLASSRKSIAQKIINLKKRMSDMSEYGRRRSLINKLSASGKYDINKLNSMTTDQLFDACGDLMFYNKMQVTDSDAINNMKNNPGRDEIFNYCKKYVGKSSPHEDAQEIEADRYGANHTKGGSNTFKKANNEYGKFLRKERKELVNKKLMKKSEYHDINKRDSEESLRRNRAIADKKIRDNDTYK